MEALKGERARSKKKKLPVMEHIIWHIRPKHHVLAPTDYKYICQGQKVEQLPDYLKPNKTSEL